MKLRSGGAKLSRRRSGVWTDVKSTTVKYAEMRKIRMKRMYRKVGRQEQEGELGGSGWELGLGLGLGLQGY